MANDIFEKDEYKLNHAGEELDEKGRPIMTKFTLTVRQVGKK